jgi:ABC-type branched-subunit amino acid transport system substrate-binding protein
VHGVADVARDAMHDPQVVAVIADLDNATARTTIPLFNAAGILHVSPGATYSGFLARGSDPTEPERWRPSGRTSFAPVPPSDAAQAVALADAARGRTTVEASADPDAEALAAAIRSQLERRDPRGSGETVIYAGTDPEDAIGVVGGLLDEQPRARILLPEALARTDLLLRRFAPEPRVRFMSSAPPRDDAFEDAFAEAYDRPPQTEYAKVGYDAMKGVLAALDRAGEDAGKRQSVIDAYFEADPLSRAAEQPFRLVRRSEAVF